MKQVDICLQSQGSEFKVLEGSKHTVPNQFRFTLFTKEVTLGDINLEQYWLDTRTVYPSTKNQAPHYKALLDLWWQRCLDEGKASEKSVCESLILAHLLPYRRDNGSRRIFLDSKMSSKSRSPVRGYRKNMENLLRSSMDQEMSVVEFYESVRNIIGPPEYSEEFWKQFAILKEELLDESVRLIGRGEINRGIQLASKKWERLLKSFDRRGKRKAFGSTAIDLFSYEMRAAIHRCYSLVWSLLSRWIFEKSDCSYTRIFHHFWHQDISWPSNEFEDKSFHLLHGHIFALHPAAADFILTQTGRRLLSDWVRVAGIDWKAKGKSPEIPQMCRLLQGLSVAFYCYQERHAERRPQRSVKLTTKDYAIQQRLEMK